MNFDKLPDEIRNKLSERKTVHEWLNAVGIPRKEFDKPICLLRRLRIACDLISEQQTQIKNAARLTTNLLNRLSKV